jgi:hypothetical protein
LNELKISDWQKQLASVDKRSLIQRLFRRIVRQSIVVLVLDINDINGSYPEKEVVEKLNEKDVVSLYF